MGWKDLIVNAGLDVAKTLAKATLVEVRPEHKEVILKQPLVGHMTMRVLKHRNIRGVSGVTLTPRGVTVEHEQFGTIGVKLHNAVFTTSETVFNYDVELLFDRQKDALVSELGAATVSGVVGGLFALFTGGLVGTEMVAASIERGASATIQYAKAPKLGCLGDGQRASFPSITRLTSSSTPSDLLNAHGGSVTFPLVPGKGILTIKGDSLDIVTLKTISSRLLAQSNGVPAQA